MDRFASLQIRDFDHLEFAVADLEKGSKPWLQLGFEKIASREIAERKLKSHLLALNHAFVLVTASTLRTDPIAKFVQTHGDGVFNIAFRCDEAVAAIDVAANRGAEVVETPKYYRREFGTVHSAAIRAVGDLRHTFLSRHGNLFAEGFEVPVKAPRRPAGIRRLDHVALAVDAGKWETWSAFYEKILGLQAVESFSVETREGGIRTRLLQSPHGLIPIRLSESVSGKNAVQDYLDVNHGPGVQYAAYGTENVFATLRSIRREGVELRTLPPNEAAELTPHNVPASEMRDGIRLETGDKGYFLHALTHNITGPFFLEIVQRAGFSETGAPAFRSLMNTAQS